MLIIWGPYVAILGFILNLILKNHLWQGLYEAIGFKKKIGICKQKNNAYYNEKISVA